MVYQELSLAPDLVEAGIGRFGPYVKHGPVYANIPDVEEVFTIGMNRAVEVLAQKATRGRGASAPAGPLKVLGAHPDGGDVQVMPGKYGPYVKWAKVNATLPKDVAFNPVTDRPIHVDFLRLTGDSLVEVQVPVVFVNEDASPGLKKGGVLNIVRHELELICPNADIPDDIQIDVTGKDLGDSIHISEVTLPKGVTSAITDRDFTIATLVAPSALKSSEGDTTTADAE